MRPARACCSQGYHPQMLSPLLLLLAEVLQVQAVDELSECGHSPQVLLLHLGGLFPIATAGSLFRQDRLPHPLSSSIPALSITLSST